MLDKYKYTEKMRKELLKSIIIITDSREQVNNHITSWFDKKKLPYKEMTLKQGDYSFYIPKNEELDIPRDIYFDKEIMIERKNSLDELSGNFGTGRDRFEKELSLAKGKKYLLIERASYQDLVDGNYKAEYDKKAFLATLHTFINRYDLTVMFMPNNEYSAQWIYATFYYYLHNYLN